MAIREQERAIREPTRSRPRLVLERLHGLFVAYWFRYVVAGLLIQSEPLLIYMAQWYELPEALRGPLGSDSSPSLGLDGSVVQGARSLPSPQV